MLAVATRSASYRLFLASFCPSLSSQLELACVAKHSSGWFAHAPLSLSRLADDTHPTSSCFCRALVFVSRSVEVLNKQSTLDVRHVDSIIISSCSIPIAAALSSLLSFPLQPLR